MKKLIIITMISLVFLSCKSECNWNQYTIEVDYYLPDDYLTTGNRGKNDTISFELCDEHGYIYELEDEPSLFDLVGFDVNYSYLVAGKTILAEDVFGYTILNKQHIIKNNNCDY